MSAANTTGNDPERGGFLQELIAQLEVRERLNWRNVPITSVTDDSRRVERGALFVALRGENCDGHDYIADALRRGASAVLCRELPGRLPPCPVVRVRDVRYALSSVAANFYGTGGQAVKPIGVTGTDGKTTTTYLIRSILRQAGHRTGLIGTLKYDTGPASIESTQTTPHPLPLHAMLRDMRTDGMSHAVMEVSSHALVHRRVAHVPFDIAVLTNVTEDHLDFHGSIENYIRAKEMLFEQLSPHSVAILNADCPVWRRYARASRAAVLTYGINSLSDIKLIKRNRSTDGTRMVVRTPFERCELKTPLVGDFNCENVLAAIAAGFAAGVGTESAVRAMETFGGVPGRLEKVGGGTGRGLPSFFVDYAHTPDALGKILATLRPITRGQLICVFGCGGDRERQKRPAMGRIATSAADVTVITSDNSRSERTEDIIADITAGIDKSAGRYLIQPDRRRAIGMALEVAGSCEDVIVVCGKGAEGFQHIGGMKIPFDDRRVCRQAMESVKPKVRKTA